MMMLKDNERLDYLLGEELKIIQSSEVFSFSLDAVLLSHFASIPIARGKILDLCSGNAVIPLFLSTRSKAEIIGVEIQQRLYDMGCRSVEYNNLKDQIQMIHGDLKEMTNVLGFHQFDTVTCNPPYFVNAPQSDRNISEHYAIARHEIMCTLDDVIKACGYLVKQGGKVAMVHRPERMIDIITTMKKYNIEPKRIQLVYPKRNKEANILLIEGIKDGKAGVKILPPFYVYEDDNTYTMEMNQLIYPEKQ